MTKDFLVFLEYQISNALENSQDKNKSRCWCDGIFLPENAEDYSIKKVNDKRKIVTNAWIDEGKAKGKQIGQFIYQMTIHFGRKSISNYVKGKDLEECVPKVGADDWIYLDIENRIIEIQLL